jgi:transcription elongation factor Elf1
MDIVTVNNRQVIVCPHCNGSSMCSQAVESTSKGGYTLSCARCGNGPVHIHNISTERRTPPVCKVCEGRGYNSI